MFVDVSGTFSTVQYHQSFKMKQISGSKSRFSFNFYSKLYADVYAASVFQHRRKYFLKTDLDSAWRVLRGDYACIGVSYAYTSSKGDFLRCYLFLSNTPIFIRKKTQGLIIMTISDNLEQKPSHIYIVVCHIYQQ